MGGQIYDRLITKERTMLQAIDSELLEVMPTTQEELDIIFKPLLGR
jgi:DNA-directed RNA polymerase subunit F